MGITGKRSSFVGLIPSFRLTVEALSKYREERPGWPAPVNAGRALPICSSKFQWRKKSNMILFGGRSSSPFGKPFPVIHPRSGASGLFARATKSIFSFRLPSPRRRGGFIFSPLVGRSDHMPRNFSAKTGVGGFFP